MICPRCPGETFENESTLDLHLRLHSLFDEHVTPPQLRPVSSQERRDEEEE